jgi:hypothetical protein
MTTTFHSFGKSLSLIILLCLSFSCLLEKATGQSSDWACFTGAQMVPPSGSVATALGNFTLNTNNTITYTISYSGFSGAPTAGYFRAATCGANGGILFPFSVNGNPITGTTATLSAGQVASLLAGNIAVTLQSVGTETAQGLSAGTTAQPLMTPGLPTTKGNLTLPPSPLTPGSIRAQLFASNCAGSNCADCDQDSLPNQCEISCEPPCNVAGCGAETDVNNNGTPDSCDFNTEDVIFGIDSTNQLSEFNPATQVTSGIGALGVTLNSLAYDDVADKMYGIATNGTIYEVNDKTGATAIAPIQPLSGFANPNFLAIGFARENSNRYLYVANGATNNTEFYRVTLSAPQPHPTTKLGNITFGAAGHRQTNGFAYNPKTDTLYASSRNTDSLLTIDKNTGAILSFLGNAGINNIADIEFAHSNTTLYGKFMNGPLARFNLTNGHANIVTAAYSGSVVAFVPKATKKTALIDGEKLPISIETAHPYHFGSLVKKLGVPQASYTIHHPGATYITPHFAEFDLALWDYVIVRSPDNSRQWKYTRNGLNGMPKIPGGFWGITIPGDTAIIDLFQLGVVGSYGFKIDNYARGFTAAEVQQNSYNKTEALCGTNDSKNAICYETTEPNAYNSSGPVVRLRFDGNHGCTGWLFGSEGHILTNSHCFEEPEDIATVQIEFNAQGAHCSQDCMKTYGCPGKIEAVGAAIVQENPDLDYVLIKPNTKTDLVAKYGYLKARMEETFTGEQIYIPQHPLAWGKQLAIESSYPGDLGVCSIYSIVKMADEVVTLVTFADTQKGSSGSPLISYDDNLVVGLFYGSSTVSTWNSTPACPNYATPILDIVDDLLVNLPKCARNTDLNCPPTIPGGVAISECGACQTNANCTAPATCSNGKCIIANFSRGIGEECCDSTQCSKNYCGNTGLCECLTNLDCASGEICTQVPKGVNTVSLCVGDKKVANCAGSCYYDAQCISNECILGLCANSDHALDIGGECCRDAQCASDSCAGGKLNYCQCKVASDCGAGQYCDTGTLSVGVNSCKTLKVSCDFCTADKQCGTGMHCDGKPTGRCITGNEGYALGHSCCRDDQCASDSCTVDNGHCQCKKNSDCPTGQFCKSGVLGIGSNSCVTLKADCELCISDSQCSGLCKFGKCATGGSKPNGSSCCRDYQCQGSSKCKSKVCKP